MAFFPEVRDQVTCEDRRNRNRRKAHVHSNIDTDEKAESKAEGQEGHPGTPVGAHR